MNVSQIANDIPINIARRAHEGSSFVPEKRAEQERQSYAGQLASDYTSLSRYAKTEEKQAVLEEEFARYRQGFRRKYIAHLAAQSYCMSTMIAGPSKFPTARNRKRLDAAHRKLEDLLGYRERALHAIRRALTPELRPVMAGDVDALARLGAKIAKAELVQEQMKAANQAIRRASKKGAEAQVAALVAMGYSEGRAADLLNPDCFGNVGFASFEITNNGANIRRMKQRFEQLERDKATPDAASEGEHARVEDCPADNRVRLFFPDKPAAEVRARLKAAGFRWAPTMGAWQAYRNHRSLTVAAREAGVPEAASC